jgi:hypothetical protein
MKESWNSFEEQVKDLRRSQLTGAYRAIFSLGGNCQPAYQLRRLGLRKMAGPLDWFVSPSLDRLIPLLENRFAGWMERRHLKVLRPLKVNYAVQDTVSGMVSYHDFPIAEGGGDPLRTYPAFREKLDRRIHRLYGALAGPGPVLLVRIQAGQADTVRLKEALERIASAQIRILVVNESADGRETDDLWGLDGVCSVLLPKGENWTGSGEAWERLLSGICLQE